MTPDSYGSEPTDQSEQLKAQKIEVYLKEGLNYIKQYQPNEAIRHFIQTDVLKKVGVDCRLDEIRGFNDNLQKKTKVPFDIYNSGFAFAVKDGMPEITRSELPFLLENFNPSDPSPL